MVIILKSDNFEAEIEKSDKPVIIDAFAQWCGPCQMIAPVFEELSKELGGKYKFAKFNVDDERELAIKFGVSSIPTFVFIKEGKVVAKEMGYMSRDVLQAKIESVFE